MDSRLRGNDRNLKLTPMRLAAEPYAMGFPKGSMRMLPFGRRPRELVCAGEIYKKNKNTPLLAAGIFICLVFKQAVLEVPDSKWQKVYRLDEPISFRRYNLRT